jgi:chemotaxis methyl-accepting protein methylase
MSVTVETGFQALLEKVELERGFACSSYKHSCLRRRIKTRMRLRGADTYEAYIELLDRDPREMDRLVAALTINVTRFFRNHAVWDAVTSMVVPSVWSSEIDNVRVWSAGCATGEEPYSMAMLFHRHAAVNGMLSQIGRLTVTGTDVDGEAIRSAALGAYSEADLAEVRSEFRTRYFTANPPFEPVAGIRRLVRFARHDLLKDRYPREPQHVVICRNVLIYFERAVQQQVIEGFRASLAPGGFLILGKVESLLASAWAFERVAARERIFRKIS